MDQSTLIGRLLVAAPLLQQDSFRRSVVLVVDDGEDGTLGLTLNRPLYTAVDEALDPWGTYASEPAVLFSGGPVGEETGIALGGVGPGEEPPGWAPLGGGCLSADMGGIGVIDLDSPPEPLGAALAGLRVFAGYAGWSSGQLDGEIAEGAWYVVEAVRGDLFTSEPDRLWSRVLRRQGGDLALLSTFPDDPEMN